MVYSKGSDARVLPLLDENVAVNSPDVLRQTTTNIDKLAGSGLRTLIVARRKLDSAFYEGGSLFILAARISDSAFRLGGALATLNHW